MEYDFRSRFHLGLRDIGTTLSLAEAARLVSVLQCDPSSATAAAVAGWPHPVSRESLALFDLIDIQGTSLAGRKWQTYPRPWAQQSDNVIRRGDAAGRSREEVIEILRQFGHGLR